MDLPIPSHHGITGIVGSSHFLLGKRSLGTLRGLAYLLAYLFAFAHLLAH